MCDDGRCIHVHQICDFKSDCYDASDEFCGNFIFDLLKIIQVFILDTKEVLDLGISYH